MQELLLRLNLNPKTCIVVPFRSEEDDSVYQVWKIETPEKTLVLKKAKEDEINVYQHLLQHCKFGVPQIYQIVEYHQAQYLLMEYIQGETLCKGTLEHLKLAVDALIQIQDSFWLDDENKKSSYHYAEKLTERIHRRHYLNDPTLEQCYDSFLQEYQQIPCTLCHDDLLPFNVLVNKDSATIIDWETAGILPYLTSFARLIAHYVEDEDALFSLNESDQAIIIDYYYNQFVASKMIRYEKYRHSLDLFIFYEYCEWIYVANKHHDTSIPYYQFYLPKAKQLANKLLDHLNG